MKITKYLNASPVFAINSAYEAIVSDINRFLKSEDTNLLQGLVLTALLFEDKDNITPSQLATVFQTSRGNISHIVSHLEYKGWVKREVSPKDARQFQIILKPEGRKKALKLIKYYDKIQDLFESELGVNVCKNTAENITVLKETYLKSIAK
ncbi:MarR family transcriptional regulator [Bdellovibrio sp. qaytius]|nr:MarR family transcriptional regulator [Bdellovibrio sp. qaytius]